MKCPQCELSGYYTYSSHQSRFASGFNKTYKFKCRVCENVIELENSHEDVNSQVLIASGADFTKMAFILGVTFKISETRGPIWMKHWG